MHQLNTIARQALVAAGELDPEQSVTATIDVGGATGSVTVPISIGEPVITTRADRALGVINGTRGTVARLHDDGALTLQTSADTSIVLPPAYLADGGLHPAYALSAHRAQGSTAPAALVLADTSTMTAEWGYSAATRGRRNDLYVLAPTSGSGVSSSCLPSGEPRRPPEPYDEERAALLVAMTRTSDEVTALDLAHQQGLAPDRPGNADPELATTPTEETYQMAARLVAVGAQRGKEVVPFEVLAVHLAEGRARSAASVHRRADSSRDLLESECNLQREAGRTGGR